MCQKMLIIGVGFSELVSDERKPFMAQPLHTSFFLSHSFYSCKVWAIFSPTLFIPIHAVRLNTYLDCRLSYVVDN